MLQYGLGLEYFEKRSNKAEITQTARRRNAVRCVSSIVFFVVLRRTYRLRVRTRESSCRTSIDFMDAVQPVAHQEPNQSRNPTVRYPSMSTKIHPTTQDRSRVSDTNARGASYRQPFPRRKLCRTNICAAALRTISESRPVVLCTPRSQFSRTSTWRASRAGCRGWQWTSR